MIALNVILCLAVIAFVVAPLAWAVRTAHRDHSSTATTVTPRRRAVVTPARRARARAAWTPQRRFDTVGGSEA